MLITQNLQLRLARCVLFLSCKQRGPTIHLSTVITAWFLSSGKKCKYWIWVLEFICMPDWSTNQFMSHVCVSPRVLEHTAFSSWWSHAHPYSIWSRTRRYRVRKPCTAIYHVHFLADIQSAGEQVAHWEKSWQKIWVGRKRNSCLRQDIPSCWRHCMISEAFLSVSWGQPVHRWHHFGKSTL